VLYAQTAKNAPAITIKNVMPYFPILFIALIFNLFLLHFKIAGGKRTQICCHCSPQ
jgi:hypothetical protein